MKYQKKPIVIDAIRWTGQNIDDVMSLVDWDLLPKDGENVNPGIGHSPSSGQLTIPTLEGTMTASAGDWIIKGVKGELYPCKHEIFEATYELCTNTEGG